MTLPAPLQESLAGRYTILRELGGGGMSRVWLARENALGREVVLKVLADDLAASVSAERFAREIGMAARLQQANIVPVLSAGEAGGVAYYTMPFVAGESLRARLARHDPVPITEAIGILRDVARALAYAHAEGVVHRDIKPENILLSGGTAVVTDFGIAKALTTSRTQQQMDNTLTTVGTSMGTPRYMAPEQAAGDPGTDHRADLYAWGLVAWEVLTGRHPFDDRTTPQSLIAAQMGVVPPPPSTIRADVPRALDRLIVRCLAKDPAERPASAGEIVVELETLSTGSATASRTPRMTPVTRALGVFVIVVAIGAALVLSRRSRNTASPGSAAQSIAVLPFEDLSPDHSNAYLGDGVAETLINALMKLPGLNVAARTSAFSLRDKTGDVRTIGKELGVATVLTGSIQRAGAMLRLTVHLVKAADRVELWSHQFDRPSADIFAVEDEVAKNVVGALQMRLTPAADSSLGSGETRNTGAYDDYLLGRFYWNKRTTADMVRAADYFKQAVAADSLYGRAWSGLADSYVLFVPNEYDVPGINQDSILTLAEQCARRALAIAPKLGEAYSSLGEILEYRLKWDDARSAFEKGVALSPGYATGHQWYSYDLMAINRWDDAVREMQRAMQLDPLSPVIVYSVAFALDGADRYAESTPILEKALELSPEASYGLQIEFGHHLALKDYGAAANSFRHLMRVTGIDNGTAERVARGLENPATRAATALDVLPLGRPELGVAAFRWLRGDAATIALVASFVGTRRARDVSPYWMNAVIGPGLRADPRMQAVLKKLDYPPAMFEATR